MKKDLKTLNRSLAIAIAAAMTMTSVPSTLFAADFTDSDVAVEAVEPEETEAPVDVEEEPAVEEATEFSSDAAETEDVFSDHVSEEATVDTADVQVGTPGTPAKVTGLYIDTDKDYVSSPVLRWNTVEGAYKYEFAVTDAAGNEYGYVSTDSKTGKYVFRYASKDWASAMPSYDVTNLAGQYAYKIAADGSDYESIYADAEKKVLLKSLSAGQTYNIRVRAVNRYQDPATPNAEAVETVGEWSDPVVYAVPATYAPVQLTNLRYASEDDDNLYFAYDGAVTAGSVHGQYTSDPDYANLYEWEWEDAYADASKTTLAISKSDLESGKTYYLRVINRVNGNSLTDAQGKDVWSNVVTFTYTAKQADPLKTITGLTMYNEGRDSYSFRFDPVLEEDDKWELQWSKDPNFVTDVQSSAKGTDVSKYSMETGATYYVRAITYKYGAKGIEYGTPSNIVTIVKAKEPTASNLVLAEKTEDGYVFKYTGNIKLPNSGIQLWISKDPGFINNPSLTKLRTNSDGEEQFTLYNSYFEPGYTYYVRIRPYSEDSSLEDSNKADETWYGAFSNTVTVSPKVSDVNVTAEVASTSITLTATAEDPSYATGYQFQKKVGKKYQNLGKTTNGIYTDKKLKPNTAYTYRVRAYYVSEKTGKVSYGAWKTYTTLTWGGNLNVRAVAKGKTSVKLTWNKLKGAQGYEVFRTVTDSYGKSYSADQGRTNTYEKWTLVKDIKKASAKTYTVKRLAAGQDYRFKVRAYKVVNGKKYYIEDEDSCTLDFALWIVSSKQNANGTLKLTWNPVYAGNGYLIEKKNRDTGVWEAYKTITRAATSSFTFPSANGQTDTYRIRAYKNGNPKTYTEDYSFEVDPYLAAPTGVKATVNKADGSITVKWNPVAGADYYEVYRTTRAASTYNKDTKTYSYSYGYANRLDNWVVDANSKYGYKVSDEDLTATTTTDRKVSYVSGDGIEQTWYEGPKAGVKYYYYVVAVKNGTAYAVKDSGKTIESGNSAAAAATVTNVTVAKTKITSGKATKGKVTLKWKKVAGAAGYEVYRSTKKGSGYTKLATITKGSTVKLTDKTVKAGKKYYYKVRAYKANEAGVDVYAAYSAAKAVKAK